MKTILILTALISLAGCASARVIVKDCQDLAGTGDMKNCELIRKL